MDAGQWLNALLLAGDVTRSPFPLQPAEFSTQQEARTSNLSLRAIFKPRALANQGQNSDLAGLMASLGRATLAQSAAAQVQNSVQVSQWSYKDVLRSSVQVDAVVSDTPLFNALAAVEPAIQVQRGALDLAGSSEQVMWLANNSVSIDSIVHTPPSSCTARYQWELLLSRTHRMYMEFMVPLCPQAQTIGSFSRWNTGVLSASGFVEELENDAVHKTTPIEARVWLSHDWGDVPATGGAVVLDTVSLDMGDQRTLQVSRSKRRSGRGPETVLAQWLERDTVLRNVDMDWHDSDERVSAASGTQYPASIRLVSAKEDIDLVVRIMNRAMESDSGYGKSLDVPVIVSGSHSGSGFLSYMSVDRP